LHSAVYTISHVFSLGGEGWGGGGDETFPKFAKSFTKNFAKILAKFHELKISKKPQHYVHHSHRHPESLHRPESLVCQLTELN